jgi:hypothetical protein
MVLTIETDPNGAAIKGVNDLAGQFPFAQLGMAALKSKLQQQGINYDTDLHPLFGNPIAIALVSSNLSTSGTQAVVVWTTKDAGTLKSLITKTTKGVHQGGSHDGATLYASNGSGAFALDGATLIAASTQQLLTAALDRHAHGGGITTDQYSKAFTSLPQNGVIKVFGNLSSVLSQPSAANARRVPWVAALKAYAATVTASSSGLRVDFHLDTTGAPLTTAQLPFASGTTAPAFAGSLPITVSVHDPAQIVAFIESAQQVSSPSSYAAFVKRQAALRAKTGTDLNSLVKLLTGDLIVSSDTKTTMGRVTVTDPAAAAQTLAKLMTAPKALSTTATGVTKTGSFYRVKQKDGTVLTLGVVGDQLVVGQATVAQLQQFAAATPTPAAGAQGTVAFKIALASLIGLATHGQQLPQEVQPILSSIGDLTGWAASSTSGLTGNATVAVK